MRPSIQLTEQELRAAYLDLCKGISVYKVAAKVGVDYKTLKRLLEERFNYGQDLALREMLQRYPANREWLLDNALSLTGDRFTSDKAIDNDAKRHDQLNPNLKEYRKVS